MLDMCWVADCNSSAKTHGLCKRHYMKFYDNGGTRPAGQNAGLTAEQRAEIARRVRKFENPRSLAKEYGVTLRTIKDIMARQ